MKRSFLILILILMVTLSLLFIISTSFAMIEPEMEYGSFGILDLEILSQLYGLKQGDQNFDESKDLNNDTVIDLFDLVELGRSID